MTSTEELNASLDCKELEKLRVLYPELDFADILEEKPEMVEHLRQSLMKEAMVASDPLLRPDAPKFNEDFSDYFVINNLPKCKEAKIPKLVTLIASTLAKKNLTIAEEKVSIPINPETQETDGVAFVEMNNEENARIGAAIFDGFKLTKNNIFATCLLPEYEKIMQTSEEFELPQAAADLEDLRAPIFDVKRDQYLYKSGKDLIVNYFDAGVASNKLADENIIKLENCSDKISQWSPKGTYLIVIKPDKVLFLGGKSMTPIITLSQSKVRYVSMSPCERYVLTYSPMGDVAFTVWEFQLVEVIREFEIADDEDEETYRWSFDGDYLAKKFRTETKKEGSDEVKHKEGISVYTLPSMQLLQNDEGQKRSITIDGIKDWGWAPARNLLVYTCFFEEESKNQIDPRIGFMKIPNRSNLSIVPVKGCLSLDLYFHPQGNYLAVKNQYQHKKTISFQIECFDLNAGDMIPQQQIPIKREVYEFTGLHWEPNNRKLAIHVLTKKSVDAGRRDYGLDSKRHGVDIYEMHHDSQVGFIVKHLANHPSDKVIDFSWSPAGEVFALQEKEGQSVTSKSVWSFYITISQMQPPQDQGPPPAIIRGKGGKQLAMQKTNQLAAEEVKYEFRKTARHETTDGKTVALWDDSGRYFVVYGVKKAGPFDKEKRNINIYSLFGEKLQSIEKIDQLSLFQFRPRPGQILTKKQLNTLKKDYRKIYGKQHREEELKQRNKVNDNVRETKKGIRDEFLDNFFLPLRRQYEADMEKYKNLWPLKEADLVENTTVSHVYQYGDLVETKKHYL